MQAVKALVRLLGYTISAGERSGLLVECLTRDGGVEGSSLTGFYALCPSERHINPCLVLVLPRKTPPNIPEKLLTWM